MKEHIQAQSFQPNNLFNESYFNIIKDENDIVTLTAKADNSSLQQLNPIDTLNNLAKTILSIEGSNLQIKAIAYHLPFGLAKQDLDYLVPDGQMSNTADHLKKILLATSQFTASLLALKALKIPLIAISNNRINSIQFAAILWADYTIGLPEFELQLTDSSVGLFPGLGVSVLSLRKYGLKISSELILKASTLNVQMAQKTGLIDAFATDEPTAHKILLAYLQKGATKSSPLQTTKEDPNRAEDLANLKHRTSNRMPGAAAYLQLLETIDSKNLEDAFIVENHLFNNCLSNPLFINIFRTMYLGVKESKKIPQQYSEDNQPPFEINTLSVIGAGTMGAGISFVSANAGIKVWLRDTTTEQASKGKAYSEKCADRLIAQQLMNEAQKTALLNRITPLATPEDMPQTDLIIEAVFENEALKAEIIKQSFNYINSPGLYASNTTSIPITKLASYSQKPSAFIGMHFFSPVDRMPLVEIIVGKQTSNESVASALHFAHKLGKIPIVVKDSPAFFTSRIFFNYLLEAITMLLEGIPAPSIEQAAAAAGFATGPLAVLDEITLPLMVQVYEGLPELNKPQRRVMEYLKKLIAEGRTGRRSGKGFYDYLPDTKQKILWQDSTLNLSEAKINLESLQKRLLSIMALDSYRCLNEGILSNPIDADLGSILGVGFPVHLGGSISYIHQIGLQRFVEDCEQFKVYGEQWTIPTALRKQALSNFTFYTLLQSNWPS